MLSFVRMPVRIVKYICTDSRKVLGAVMDKKITGDFLRNEWKNGCLNQMG